MYNSFFVLLFLIQLLIIYSDSFSNFFHSCDKDKNKILSKLEIDKCINKSSFVKVMDTTQFMNLLDTDGDGLVSLIEYSKISQKVKQTTENGDQISFGMLF